MTIDEAIKELQEFNSSTFETRFVTFPIRPANILTSNSRSISGGRR